MKLIVSTLAIWAAVSNLLVDAAVNKFIKRQVIQDEYDFVICGGGTAGLVLADRLSESGRHTVLVLEAGPEPTVVSAYIPPGGNQFLAGTAIDYPFYTVPQEHLNNRILAYHRGRGLGGSSVINGLFYSRGSASVYDKWVELGNPGWGWHDIYPLYVRGTHFNPSDPNTGFDQRYRTYDPSAYSDGPLQLGYQGYVPETNIAFIEACEAANVPIVHELNTGNGTGIKQGTGCMDSQYRRSSSFDSYYRRAAGRPNLSVLHDAYVMEIVTSTEGGPRADGVFFKDGPTGLFHSVNARKEVIVSMGAFHTPQLLMVSGIGPTEELDKLGISHVLINENIGRHLNDHSVFSVYATVGNEVSTSQMYASGDNLIAAQREFYNNLTGPYTAPSGITNGFQMLSNEELESIGAGEIIRQGLTNQSHIEYLYESMWYPGGPTPFYTPRDNESYISLTASSLVALSRGNVTLKSDSMADLPNVNPNYYADPTDRIIAIQSFKYLRRILRHPALARYTIGPFNGEVSPGPAIGDNDDDAIFEYVKENTIPNWHASGTAQMLPLEHGGVVDPRLRLYGVQKLRVVDCSVIPRLPDVNIQAPVFMIAEKGAQMIREDWHDV